MKHVFKKLFIEKENTVPQGSAEDRPLHGAPTYFFPTGRSLPKHLQDRGVLKKARKWNKDDSLIGVTKLKKKQKRKKRWYQKEGNEPQEKLLHNSSKKIKKIKSTPSSAQAVGSKPEGFWYSCGHEWLGWVRAENPKWEGKHNYEIEIDYSKILRITNLNELVEFTKKYGKSISGRRAPVKYLYPDWKSVAEEYSGIEICPYISEARFKLSWYYTWDVASGCIWDASSIKNIKEISKIKKEEKNENLVLNKTRLESPSKEFGQSGNRSTSIDKKLPRTEKSGKSPETKEKIDWSSIKKNWTVEHLHPKQIDHGLLYYHKDAPEKPIAGVTFATVDWEDYKIVHIILIGVNPKWRNLGLGKAIIRDLSQKYGYNNIDWGYTTEEGEALRQSAEKEMEPYKKRGYDMWGKSLKEIFFEAEEVPPEAKTNDIFGQYLFAPDRRDTPRPAELNTKAEDELKSGLWGHYYGTMEDLSSWVPKIKSLVKKGKYKKLLEVPKNYKYAYRFMTVRGEKFVAKILGRKLTEEERETGIGQSTTGTFYGKWEGRTHFSWTVEANIIKSIKEDWDFLWTHGWGDKDMFLVLMRAPIEKNNFFLNPDEMAATGIPGQYKYQKEIISAGNVTLDKIVFARYPDTSGEYSQTYSKVEEWETKILNQFLPMIENKHFTKDLWRFLKEYYPHDPAINDSGSKSGIEGEFNSLNQIYYHGSNKIFAPGDYIKPPKETGELSEKGRKKNLDKVFFTLDKGSAKIYADRAVKSFGKGTSNIYIIQPIGEIEWVNKTKGTTVLMASMAKVIKKVD